MFVALFGILIAYFAYFQVFKSESVISSSYNPRLNSYEENVLRGPIYSQDGELLAYSEENSDGSQSRIYPHGSMFAHVVGYSCNGKSGIEKEENFSLLQSHSFIMTQVINDLKNEKSQGDTVITTLNYKLQETAYNALGGQQGAVVVLEPSTGKVLAMVSKPDFDPNTLAANWDDIISDESSTVLLNRAAQGLYPPGSTFKIVTTLEYMREKNDYDDFFYNCSGAITTGGIDVHCYDGSVHGDLDLETAFAKSCNTSFAKIGLSLNPNRFTSTCEELLFNKALPTGITSSKSRFELSKNESEAKVAQTAIGQGDTLVTPLHMAMIAAAVDNDGVVMRPYVTERVENDAGIEVKTYEPSEYGSVMTSAEAAQLKEYMDAVVEKGTASKLSGQDYSAGGKTGTAEFSSKKDESHSWFVGYCSKDGKEDIAIAVIVEGAGVGSEYAVPIAKQVFDAY